MTRATKVKSSFYSFVLILLLIFSASCSKGEVKGGPVPGTFYYSTDRANTKMLQLPLTTQFSKRIRVFDRQIAYRNDKKACVAFEVPLARNEQVQVMRIEAYNDDNQYLRAIWIDVDGIGGYIGVSKIGQGQYRGDGTIGPKQTKKWELPMKRFPFSLQGKTDSEEDFSLMLSESGEHTICGWISTYEKYGPGSWITMDLEIRSM